MDWRVEGRDRYRAPRPGKKATKKRDTKNPNTKAAGSRLLCLCGNSPLLLPPDTRIPRTDPLSPAVTPWILPLASPLLLEKNNLRKKKVHGTSERTAMSVHPSARDRGAEKQARKGIPSGPVQMQSFSAVVESGHLTRAYEFKGPVQSTPIARSGMGTCAMRVLSTAGLPRPAG